MMDGRTRASQYHPEHHIDGEDRGHASKRQALEDAAAGVRPVASLRGAVFIPERIQEAESVQLCSRALRRGRSRHQQLSVRHQRWK